jgi:hypothetical protein
MLSESAAPFAHRVGGRANAQADVLVFQAGLRSVNRRNCVASI